MGTARACLWAGVRDRIVRYAKPLPSHNKESPMNQPLVIALAAAVAVAAAGCASKSTPADDAPAGEPATASDASTSTHVNPFFSESSLPLHYPRFDEI